MISASILRASSVAARATRRPLTTTCTQSIQTLNNILESYRASNYSRELPRRFREDVVSIASKRSSPFLPSTTSTGVVSAEGIEQLLSNIGAGDEMSHDEIENLLREVGGNKDSCTISANQLLDLISNRI